MQLILWLTVDSDSAFGQIVFIDVGPDPVRFGIHEGVLRQKSTWFKNTLETASGAKGDKNDRCDQPRAIIIAEEDPAIFRRFNDWIYTQKLCTEAETPKDLSWTTIFDIYTFAERRGIPNLQNACINVIIRKVKNGGPFPTQEILNPLWKTTGKVSQLRLLLLELYAAKCDLKAALVRNGGFHHRFLHDLVIILYEMKEGDLEQDPDFWKRRHKYYVSTPDNPVALD